MNNQTNLMNSEPVRQIIIYGEDNVLEFESLLDSLPYAKASKIVSIINRSNQRQKKEQELRKILQVIDESNKKLQQDNDKLLMDKEAFAKEKERYASSCKQVTTTAYYPQD